MKRCMEGGQLFPLVGLVLFVCIFFIGANIERLRYGIQKIENQRQADSVLLGVVNEQARALNAIAGLNQGLQIAVERGYAIATALLAVQACVMTPFPPPPCVSGYLRLGAKAPSFYRKLSKLGAELAKQQDQIAGWAADRPAQLEEWFNVGHLGVTQVFLFPSRREDARLSIRRGGAESFQSMGASPEESRLADGGDVKRCEIQRFGSFADLKIAWDRHWLSVGKNDSLTVEYANPGNGSRKTIQPRTASEISEITLTRTWGSSSYQFQNARLSKCQSFQDILSQFGFGSVVQIPTPYLLQQSFFEGHNRFALARVIKSEASKMHMGLMLKKTASQRLDTPDLWALSEAEIAGGNLSQMEFSPILSPVRFAGEIWNVVELKQPVLSGQGFGLVPRIQSFGTLIAH